MWKWLPCVCCVTMHLILGAGFSIFSPVWPLSAPLTPLRKLQLVAFLQGEWWQPWTDSSALNYPQAPWKASVEWLRHAHCVIPSAFLHSSAADWTIKACPLWPFTSCYITKPFLGEIPLWKRIIISINIAQSWYIFNEIITLSWHLPLWSFQCNIFKPTELFLLHFQTDQRRLWLVTVKLQCFWVTESVMPHTQSVIMKTWDWRVGCKPQIKSEPSCFSSTDALEAARIHIWDTEINLKIYFHIKKTLWKH